MIAVDLLASALPAATPPEMARTGVCCVTGAHGPTIPRGHAIKDSFTGLDILRAPLSERVGLAAWRVLTYSVDHHDPAKRRDLYPLRQSHWICDGASVQLLDRRVVRAHVLNGVAAPAWAGYATTSYKKHGALLAPVNSTGRQVWLWETRRVDCSDRAAVADTWQRLRAAQDAGIPRPLIEQLDVMPAHIAKLGWRVWADFERWARPRLRAPLYQFLTYLLPSQEELACLRG